MLTIINANVINAMLLGLNLLFMSEIACPVMPAKPPISIDELESLIWVFCFWELDDGVFAENGVNSFDWHFLAVSGAFEIDGHKVF